MVFDKEMGLKVGLVQVNNSFSGASYLPLAVANLQAYAQKFLRRPQDYEFMLPIYKRLQVGEAVSRLLDADLVAFSLYTWNKNLSLAIARALKLAKPTVLTVFGGPEIPDNAENFLRAHPYVNIACHNEGEQAFVHVLEKAPLNNWYDIPSVSFIGEDGTYHKSKWLERMRKLEIMPSPFLNGVFGPLMEANPGEQWLGLWETNRGCPFSCSFCDWGSNTKNKVIRFDLETLYGELEWFGQHKIEFIFCCDANFFIFQRDVDIARKAAEVRARYGYPHALSVQNAKNAAERIFEGQLILANAGLNKGVTLAFQSRTPEVLEAIDRDNISSEDFRVLQKRFTEAGVETYSDMIIALPLETYDSFADGVSQTIVDGQHNRIQFGNLSMMPNAPMAEPDYIKRFGLKMQEICAVIYHGVIQEDEVPEVEDIVVETSTLSREDWVRTRVFCWMTSLLHFDKIFQIPLVVLHEETGTSYRELIEVFTEGLLEVYPTLREIRDFFVEKAKSIQTGGIEYCPAPEWLGIYWPADEYIFIKLCREGKLDRFYQEAAQALLDFFRRAGRSVDEKLLWEAIDLNKSLIKLPLQSEDLHLCLSYNIFEFYRAVMRMEPIPLRQETSVYTIDRASGRWESWDEWCRFVVWYGNKKGAYLYGNIKNEPEHAGHF